MAGGSRANRKKRNGVLNNQKHSVSSPAPDRQTRSSAESTAKKSNQSNKAPSSSRRKQLKSPDRKKSKEAPNPLSPTPFAPSTQKTGNQASAAALQRFDIHICASGEQFCRAPWTIPIGHTCVPFFLLWISWREHPNNMCTVCFPSWGYGRSNCTSWLSGWL